MTSMRGSTRGGSLVAAARHLAGIAWLLAVTPPTADATILLFGQERNSRGVVPASAGSVLPDDYGDNVAGLVMAVPGGSFNYGNGGEGFTPDVTVDIFTSTATSTDPGGRLWPGDYGDLVDVVFGHGPGIGGSPMLSVRLQAAPGFVVDLYGFDLAGWNRSDYTIAGVEILAGAVSLYADSDVLVEGNATGPGHTSLAFATPLSAQELLIQLDLSNLASSLQDNIGIDSIRFGQTPPPVPEPGTALLVLCGLAITAAARRQGRAPSQRP